MRSIPANCKYLRKASTRVYSTRACRVLQYIQARERREGDSPPSRPSWREGERGKKREVSLAFRISLSRASGVRAGVRLAARGRFKVRSGRREGALSVVPCCGEEVGEKTDSGPADLAPNGVLRVERRAPVIVSCEVSLSARMPLSNSVRSYIFRSGKVVGCLPALASVQTYKNLT